MEWIALKGYEGRYEINRLGQIRTLKNTPKLRKYDILKPVQIGNYLYVFLYNDERCSNVAVHHLVAEMFLENPNGYKFINHIDGNRQNNSADNLEYNEQSYYKIHLKATNPIQHTEEWFEKIKEKSIKQRKPVIQLSNGQIVAKYESAQQASRITHIGNGNITKCCKGGRSSAGGYQWRYYAEQD